MSGLNSFDELDEGEPPSPRGSLSLERFFGSVANQTSNGLHYSDYANTESNCFVAVNLHDLEIVAKVKDYGISQVLSPSIRTNVGDLEQRVSSSMARAAANHGFAQSLDPEHDYPAFINASDRGAFSLMFGQPHIRAMLIGDRPGSDDRLMSVRSQHIHSTGELVVLLAGLTTLLTVFETKKHHSMRK